MLTRAELKDLAETLRQIRRAMQQSPKLMRVSARAQTEIDSIIFEHVCAFARRSNERFDQFKFGLAVNSRKVERGATERG